MMPAFPSSPLKFRTVSFPQYGFKASLSATLNAVRFYESAEYVEEGPIVHRLPTGVELQCLRMSKELGHS